MQRGKVLEPIGIFQVHVPQKTLAQRSRLGLQRQRASEISLIGIEEAKVVERADIVGMFLHFGQGVMM